MRWILVAVVLAFAGGASARPAYTRNTSVNIRVQLSARSKPVNVTPLPPARFKTDDRDYNAAVAHIDAGRYPEALERFLKVALATASDPRRAALHAAAKRGFVVVYAEIGKADKAIATFERVDKANALELARELAAIYGAQGKTEKGIYMFRELITRTPRDPKVCEWQYRIAHLSLSSPGMTNADKVTEIENLVKLYVALKSQLPAAVVHECRENARALSGELARAYHSESSKTRNGETLVYAGRLYKVYLDAFPDAADHAEMSYYYAELLWWRATSEGNPRLATALWEETATAFTAVVTHGNVDATTLEESANAATLAWKNALAVDPQLASLTRALDHAKATGVPAAIPDRESRFVAAMHAYAKLVGPQHENAILEAAVYRRYHHHDKALPLLESVLANQPGEHAEVAAQLLLDTLAKLGRRAEARSLAERYAADKAFLKAKPALAADVAKLRR